ncbi:MAG TPA: lysophospholipid acyltransferase family protein [Kofleriaceae bacterium]|nr:lysophospholipid acyltransferase family protein [Kofleriaceae bacterium]
MAGDTPPTAPGGGANGEAAAPEANNNAGPDATSGDGTRADGTPEPTREGGVSAATGPDGEQGEPREGSLDAVPDAHGRPAWADAADSPHEVIFKDPELWGGEAVVPPHEVGPPITTHFPDSRTVTSEIRELERRVRARLTPVFPLESRRAPVPVRAIWRRYRDLAMRGRSAVVDEWGRDPAIASRFAPLLDFLYRRYFRARAEGIEGVPPDGRAILVANHSGALPYDALMLMRAVELEARRQVRPLLEDEVFHFPYLGTFLNRMGAVRASPENAARLLADDELVAVFPEGIQGIGKLYRDRYQLQRFGRGGFVKLALRTGAPIIPVAVVGAEEASPMLAKVTWLARAVGLPHVPVTPTFPLLGPLGLMPLPSKWILRFGAPMDLASEHGEAGAEDRLLVARLADQIRSNIQGMIDETRAERRSPLRG